MVQPYDEVTRTLEPWVRNYRPQATGYKLALLPDPAFAGVTMKLMVAWAT